MNTHLTTESPSSALPLPSFTRSRATRTGKIARLPRHIRDQLNQRLDDGEPGNQLVDWLNRLPEVQTILAQQFDGEPISPQNLSRWRQGGFRDWQAQVAAEDWLADNMEEAGHWLQPGTPSPNGEASAPESMGDRIAQCLMPYWVATVRQLLAETDIPEARWGILKPALADLAVLRRAEHQRERLRLTREKLRIAALKKEVTEADFLAWAKTQKDIDQKLHPERKKLSNEERRAKMYEILGINPKYHPSARQPLDECNSPEPIAAASDAPATVTDTAESHPITRCASEADWNAGESPACRIRLFTAEHDLNSAAARRGWKLRKRNRRAVMKMNHIK